MACRICFALKDCIECPSNIGNCCCCCCLCCCPCPQEEQRTSNGCILKVTCKSGESETKQIKTKSKKAKTLKKIKPEPPQEVYICHPVQCICFQ
ncbi:hypothetical protein TSMEX_002782 [Taenia solium]|eukprot:TsM_000205900 transcript=TsM_000205900 gene=TsM_000205900